MRVPYAYLSFCPNEEPASRWDQRWIERILHGEEWMPPGGFEFYEIPQEPPNGLLDGGVLIFPTGHYSLHCGTGRALTCLRALVRRMAWSVIIGVSDEGSTFPWARFEKPDNCHLWVMTPRPEKQYPEGTRFIGEGCPWAPCEVANLAAPDWLKTTDLFFAGQINTDRRRLFKMAMDRLEESGEYETRTLYTGGFRQGATVPEYMADMCRARLAPCPTGRLTQDSFRFYEALEAQAVPIADYYRPRYRGIVPLDYWSMIAPDLPDLTIYDWEDLPHAVVAGLESPWLAPRVSAWWQNHKRIQAYRLHNDVAEVSLAPAPPLAPIDQITVLMVTSPSPLHPSTEMIQETLSSVGSRLPDAEILIGIDGVRQEQEELTADYAEYARRLCALVNPMRNILPILYPHHRHQSGMVRDMLDRVVTPYVLFMEHDAPLVGEIDFADCVMMMGDHDLNLLRFHYDDSVHPDHAYLYLETSPEGRYPYVRTVQYSARPHLIRTEKLRSLLTEYFGTGARTFLEDSLHGSLQWLPEEEAEQCSTDRERLEAVWARHRMAVYAPRGSWLRSGHLDGRRGDTKWRTWIEYDSEETPPWSPPPGWLDV